MGNEHSANSKKSKSSTKYSNATINNYSTCNPDINSNSQAPQKENNNFILNLRKYFESPSTEKLLFGANSKLKEITHKLHKISKKEKMLKISEQLMNQIPLTLSHFVNIDLITSSFGLKSIEHNEFYIAKLTMSNKGINIGEKLLQDKNLNSFVEKTNFVSEKNLSTLGDFNHNNYANVNASINEASYIREVMDTSSSFIQILEEFEKISSPNKDKQGNVNKIGIAKSKSKNNILGGQASKYNSNNSNTIHNSIINKVNCIALKNNSKILQTNRSTDKIHRIGNESAMNEKLNISNDNSILLSTTKKNFRLNEEISKIKNIKINLSSNKQRSTSPDKKVLSKIEPTLIIDLSNRRHSKLIKNDGSVKDKINDTTLRSNLSRGNLSKSPAKEMKMSTNLMKAEQIGVYSPTDSTHSSQLDTQYLYNTNTNTNKNNESSRISQKIDMNKIKISPKILKKEKTNSNNSSIIDSEIYNTYSQLKRKSIDTELRDNLSSKNKNKKAMNSSYLSEDGVNISINNSILRDKDQKSDKRETLIDKSNPKDPQQIKNFNININELNIINKEQKSNEQNNPKTSGLGNNDDNKGSILNINNSASEKDMTSPKLNAKTPGNLQIVKNDSDKDDSSIQNKSQALNLKEDLIKKSQRDKLPIDTQDKPTPTNNSLASSAIQKLSKLKSLKINLNINQLKKIKNQDISKSISNKSLEIEKNLDEKDFSTSLEKIGFELGESDSNSRETTPPRRNTPKFNKSSNDNSHSNEMNALSEESDGGNTNSNSKIYNTDNKLFMAPETLERLNNNNLIEAESYLTNINTSHHYYRKSNSFGGYANPNTNNLMSSPGNINIGEKSDFNPDICISKAVKNEGEKFSFHNDQKENSFLVNLSQDHSEEIQSNGNSIKYVKPKIGFKKAVGKINIDSKIINEVEEVNTSYIENKSQVSETGEVKLEIGQESIDKNAFNENGDKSNTNYKSKILFKRNKLN